VIRHIKNEILILNYATKNISELRDGKTKIRDGVNESEPEIDESRESERERMRTYNLTGEEL
jgi:hypothetical protein